MADYYRISRQIEAKKKEYPVPEETCPDINKVISMLEELREDNAQLRASGREWYSFCDELHTLIGSLEDENIQLNKDLDKAVGVIDQLEKERSGM